jgi:hypothetical protein
MKLKVMLVTLFAAGLGASFALADNGHGNGKGEDHHAKSGCTEVHLRGTVSGQSLTLVVDKASTKANIAAGASVALQLGAAGQTTRVEVEACATTVGTVTSLQVKSLELKTKTAKSTTTTGTTTTGTTATTTTAATTTAATTTSH